jgi:uncharacterized protein YdiU (UPF0061 family)
LQAYAEHYERNWLDGMRAKIGLQTSRDDDKALINKLFEIMAANRADFTLTFHYLSMLAPDSAEQDGSVQTLFSAPAQFDRWARQWRARLRQEDSVDATRQARMRAVNPVYVPRNHQIEAAIRAAEDHGDFSVFHELHAVLQNPWQQQPGKDAYMLPPEPEEVVQQTFCGT